MIKILITILTLAISGYFFAGVNKNNDLNKVNQKSKIDVPANIKKIIDKSCISCHSNNGNMAKMKVNFDKIYNGEYKSKQLIKKLNGIANSVENKRMPSKKYISKHPEAKMTDAEIKNFADWAKSKAKELSKK